MGFKTIMFIAVALISSTVPARVGAKVDPKEPPSTPSWGDGKFGNTKGGFFLKTVICPKY